MAQYTDDHSSAYHTSFSPWATYSAPGPHYYGTAEEEDAYLNALLEMMPALLDTPLVLSEPSPPRIPACPLPGSVADNFCWDSPLKYVLRFLGDLYALTDSLSLYSNQYRNNTLCAALLEQNIQPIGLDLQFTPFGSPLSAISTLSLPTLSIFDASGARNGSANIGIAPGASVAGVQSYVDSDIDAEGETDMDDGTGPEYVDDDEEDVPLPPPRITEWHSRCNTRDALASSSRAHPYAPSKPPRTTRTTASRKSKQPRASSSSTSSPDLSFASPLPNQRTKCTPSRIKLLAGEPAKLPKKVHTGGKVFWQCPHCDSQSNSRTDCERHIRAHVRPVGIHICCGVPLHLREEYGVPDSHPVEIFHGRLMVGGCGQDFGGRKDTLRRHLLNTSARNRCFGDLGGDWHPPVAANPRVV